MKKYLLLCFLMFLNEHIIGQTCIRLNDGSIIQESKKALTKRTVKNVERGILVTYEFDYAEKMPDDTFAGASMIRIDGFGLGGEIETPALPLKIDRFSVPSKKSKIIIIDSAYIELPMEISPVRPAKQIICDEGYGHNEIPPIKPYHGFFPKCVVSNSLYAYRTSFIADIHVTPVQYDYQNKMVRIFSKLSYLVDNGNERLNGIKNKNESRNDDVLLSNIVMNPVDSSYKPRDVTTEIEVPGYLILSVPNYSTAVNKFAEWKRSIGFNVKTIYQNSWTETGVLDSIASSNTDNSIRYLLIVGDQEDIPGHFIPFSYSGVDYTFATDYYYGCVQQNTYPEIRRGRLSVSSADQAMTVVNKIIQYEKTPVLQQSFYNTGVNCAYYEDKNKDSIEDVRFTLTSENIRDYLVNVKGKNIYRLYDAYNNVNPRYWNNSSYGFADSLVALPSDLLRSNGFQWNTNETDIAQHINDGAFYVLHCDHGETEGWGLPPFRIYNVNNLSNGEKLPVVFSMNCLTGRYQDTCFAEAFLRKEGGGCVAIFAASGIGFSGYTEALTIGMFDAIWPSNGYFKSFPHSNTISLSSTPTYRLGDILDIGLSQISTIYDGANINSIIRITKEIFQCFGDPAMEIYTEQPTIFNNITFSVMNGVANISVPEGGKITFYNPENGNINSYDGSNVQYPYNSNLRISITKHNKIPLIIEDGTIFIQNDTITQNISYEANTIKVGTNVTSTKPTGDVIISGGVTNLKGNVVELSSGTTVEEGAQLLINN